MIKVTKNLVKMNLAGISNEQAILVAENANKSGEGVWHTAFVMGLTKSCWCVVCAPNLKINKSV